MVEFTIPGKPIGKGRPRFGKGFTYTPKKTVEYENLVRLAWMQSGAEMIEGNISVVIMAKFSIPKSVSMRKLRDMIGAPYAHKPDADNIAKAVLDPLNGLAYHDDAQVVELKVIKSYTSEEPKVIVGLEEVIGNVENGSF